MTTVKVKRIKTWFEEFNVIIEKVISCIIIPLLPFHIFGIFLNMTFAGQVAKILSVFAIVFVLIIILHFVMLLIQYTGAGTLKGKNPLKLIENDGTSVLYCSWNTVISSDDSRYITSSTKNGCF